MTTTWIFSTKPGERLLAREAVARREHRFLDETQALLDAAGLSGLVQLASFHPDYLFDGEVRESAGHFSNRAPWPTIHFIREDMLSRALGDYPDPDRIPARNVATLEALGVEELEKRWKALFS